MTTSRLLTTTTREKSCTRTERAGAGRDGSPPSQQAAQPSPTHAPAMAETGARDEATTAATEEHDKENAIANVANPKRARKQTTLIQIMASKTAHSMSTRRVTHHVTLESHVT
eukprot:5080503-Pleurochrysis_carterae.AAC.1